LKTTYSTNATTTTTTTTTTAAAKHGLSALASSSQQRPPLFHKDGLHVAKFALSAISTAIAVWHLLVNHQN
jgi:hypothetical protein